MNVQLSSPLWLLAVIIPIGLVAWYIKARKTEPTIRWSNPAIASDVIFASKEWVRHVSAGILAAVMLLGILLMANPVLTSEVTQETAMVSWVYDGSESMNTEDVMVEGATVSRYDAALLALETSLPTVNAGFDRLLVGYSDPESLSVSIPTRSNDAVLMQANDMIRGETTAIDVGLSASMNGCHVFRAENGEKPCTHIVLSDGLCEPDIIACERSSIELALTADEQDMTVNTIAFGPDADVEFLSALAAAGGGEFLQTDDFSELAGMYEDISASLGTETDTLSTPWAIRLAGLIVAALLAFVFSYKLVLDR